MKKEKHLFVEDDIIAENDLKKMRKEYYIPQDIEKMTEKYKIDKGGICGQACLAVIEGSSIQNVLNQWVGFGLEWKGWSGWKQLKEYLEKKGYEVRLKRKNNLTFNFKDFYILRIQWIGKGENKEKPFYGWGHWSEASAYTHFIIIHKAKFFCNEDGWLSTQEFPDYLKHYNGVITSGMEIKNED